MAGEPDDLLTQTRIAVARIEGMLQQALSDQAARITTLERDAATLHARLSDKGKSLATHTEQIVGLQRAVNVLENDGRARHARIIGTVGAIVGALSLTVTVVLAILRGV